MSARSSRSEADRPTAALLRGAILVLTGVALAGTTAELVITRHWESTVQVLPFVIVGVAAVALGLVAAARRARLVRIARVLSIIVLLAAAFGVWEHIEGNEHAGALDQRTAATWETTPALQRFWLAASGGVGPSPPLAPGVLAQSALMLLAATLHHPALDRAEDTERP
ncbi:MAG: hypothetical protein AB7G21_11405 [Dehalococcoidia bacterium]